MAQGGFIVLWRKLFDSWFWQLGGDDFKIAVGFVLKANWSDREWFDGTRMINVERGSFVTSAQKMADFCGVTRKKMRGSMAKLERATFLKLGTSRGQHYTVVTIVNYDGYQDLDGDGGQDTGQVGARLGPSKGHKITKEPKNHKNQTSPLSENSDLAAKTKIKKPKPKPTPTDSGLNAATYLQKRILEEAPNCTAKSLTETKIADWARTLDKIRAKGAGHEWPEIRASINWLHDSENGFVVQSAESLKKKWDAIQANRKRSQVTGKPKPIDDYERARLAKEKHV